MASPPTTLAGHAQAIKVGGARRRSSSNTSATAGSTSSSSPPKHQTHHHGHGMSSSPPAPRAGVIGEHGQALPPVKAHGGDKDKVVTGMRVQQQQQEEQAQQQTQQAGEEYPRPSR